MGVCDTDYNSVFPFALNAAVGPIMKFARNAVAGWNWEGPCADPFVSGATNLEGIQIPSCHRLCQALVCLPSNLTASLNKQPHYGDGGSGTAYSSNQDDRSFHELQLWPFAESVRAGMGSVMCVYNRVNCARIRYLGEDLDFQVSNGLFWRGGS